MTYNGNNNGFRSYFQKILIKAAPIMSAVYSLFLSTIILSFFGFYLDKKLETFPIIFLLGLIFGLILGFYQLLKILNKQKNDIL